jgi:hypothetical protein
MAEEASPEDRCPRCERRLSLRQMAADWLPVIFVAIREVVQFVSS